MPRLNHVPIQYRGIKPLLQFDPSFVVAASVSEWTIIHSLTLAATGITGTSQPPEARLQFLTELLHGERTLVRSREITMNRRRLASKFHGDVRDHHAMFFPELLNLALALGEEPVEVMDKHDAFTGRIRRAAPSNQHVVSALRGREAFSQ